MFIRHPNGRNIRHQLPTGARSTNFKGEIAAIRKAADILVSVEISKIVILTDVLSVLQSLEEKNLGEVSTALIALCQDRTVVLQWIPSPGTLVLTGWGFFTPPTTCPTGHGVCSDWSSPCCDAKVVTRRRYLCE